MGFWRALCEEVEEVFYFAWGETTACVLYGYGEVDYLAVAPFCFGGLVRAGLVFVDEFYLVDVGFGGFAEGGSHCYFDVADFFCACEFYGVGHEVDEDLEDSAWVE